MRDYYFSEYGMYLGRDDAMTNNVRIIAFSRWSSLKKILGRVNHDEAKKKSVLFSYATFNGVPGAYNNPMPDFAILGIYDWVNNIFNITRQLLFIRNEPGSNTLMTSLSRIIRNELGVPIDLAEAPIAINHIAWAELGYCDNIYNIASALDHEYMHELTWRTDLVAADQMGTPGRERIAYHYQIYQSIYWQYTTSSFKRSVQKAYNRYF